MTKQQFNTNDVELLDDYSYVVAILDGQNNPSDNLDNFSGLNEAIAFAKSHQGSGVFQERYRKDKEICEYLLVWYPNTEEVD